MSGFYTGTGDDGFTGLLGEGRVPKHDPRIEAIGALDEASAALGAARAICLAKESTEILLAVQRDLYNIMAEVAATLENAPRFRVIDSGRVEWLEEQTNRLGESVIIPTEFIVPGDSPAGAALAVSRAVVRRAERRLTELLHSGQIENTALLGYLNRLSSLCFILELQENHAAGKGRPTLAKG